MTRYILQYKRSCFLCRKRITQLIKLVTASFFATLIILSTACGPCLALDSDLYAYLDEEQGSADEYHLLIEKPLEPDPANNAGGIDLETSLKWKGVDDNLANGLYYVVYFGDTEDVKLIGATWQPDKGSEYVFQLQSLEADTNYYWRVVGRDTGDNEVIGPLWTFNTYGSVSGRILSGGEGLPDREVVIYQYTGDSNWEVHDLVKTDENGFYSFSDIPTAEYLVGLASEDYWYPDLLRIEGGKLENIDLDLEAYDFTVVLNKGWNLLSLPRWAREDGIVIQEPLEDYVESWLTYIDGEWEQGDSGMTLHEVLNNPSRAVYINTLQPTVIRFAWQELTADLKTASQKLHPGWNLVSSSYEEDYRLVLAGMADLGAGGISHISAPNTANILKGFNFHRQWQNPLISVLVPETDDRPVIYPLDGYWVYLNGEPLTYSIMVGNAATQQDNDLLSP